MIREYIKKMRLTANLLEELFDGPSLVQSINEIKARKVITQKMINNVNGMTDTHSVEPIKIKNPSPNKGYKYPSGTHWTQKPENKNKLRRVVNKLNKVNRMKHVN